MSEFAPRSILCPVDLSSASSIVLGWARLFAETYHAKVKVLHADWLEYPPYFLLSQTEELAAEARKHRAALDKILAKLAQDSLGPDLPHEITILEGHPVEEILKYAEERHPDLIVMGSHGRSGVARMRLGSVAENVMRQAAVPTFVVRTFADKPAPGGISRVLCPVNFTEHGFRCLELSAEVAARFGAELVVMHSVEQEYADLEETQDRLCQWVPEAVRRHCYVTEAVRRGNPAEQILMAARDRAVDLIVLSAQHRPFLEFTTLGTTTERVMRHADSAVLVLPGKQVGTSAEPLTKGVTSTI
jgi:nucleotide-binding universal stress UspA family protein